MWDRYESSTNYTIYMGESGGVTEGGRKKLSEFVGKGGGIDDDSCASPPKEQNVWVLLDRWKTRNCLGSREEDEKGQLWGGCSKL